MDSGADCLAKVKPGGATSFTWRNFTDLADVSRAYNSPLAVIAHVDVNAFFAQAEQIRLGLSWEDPVVCVQWNSLIAVSYAARKYGISRMDSLDSAREKCPNIVPAHTAVFRKGEPYWSYVEGFPAAADHKVSLDPYRRESRKMMRIFRDFCDHVEKASVDESFLDFGRLVVARLVELFPCLNVESADPESPLPPVPVEIPDEIAQWKGYIVRTDEDEENACLVRDWDDVVMLVGSHLAQQLRDRIRDELGYLTSCGIGRVKTVAKLASGFKKPDNQTIVRNAAIPEFLKSFKLVDFWSMGGKTGEFVQQALNVPEEDSIEYIRRLFSLQELEERLKDKELALKVYKLVRGEMAVPITLRTDIKAMGTSKNFRGASVSCNKDVFEWFKVFSADLANRLSELDEEDGILNADKSARSVRRPKTIGIHFTQKSTTKSKQCPIPQLPSVEKLKELIYINGCRLVEQLEDIWNETVDGPMYPAFNCSLSLSSFSNVMVMKSIDEFMAKTSREESLPQRETPATSPVPTEVWMCDVCGKELPLTMEQEHRDWHVASAMAQEILEEDGNGQLSYAEILLQRRRNQTSRSATPVSKVRKPKKTSKPKKTEEGFKQSTLPFT